MDNDIEFSLLTRLGIYMSAIVLLGFMTLIGSFLIGDMTEGEAGSINRAGSLRMQAYRIGVALNNPKASDHPPLRALVDAFEQRLNDPRLTFAIPKKPSDELRTAYNQVHNLWQHTMRPLLIGDIQSEHYLDLVDTFVYEINQLVILLEQDVETKIAWIRILSLSALFLLLIVILYTMRMMHNNVRVPLRDLMAFARRAHQGNLSQKVPIHESDELGELARLLNNMATELTKSYTSLEERVSQKTEALEQTNRALELLYKTTSRLNDVTLSPENYQGLLDDIVKFIGFGPGLICLTQEDDQRFTTLASSYGELTQTQNFCSNTNCNSCTQKISTQSHSWQTQGENHQSLSVPIQDHDERYGTLVINLPPNTRAKEWQIQLLEAVSGHIGRAISNAYKTSANKRLSLHEERSVIARELHDSLAQSLSYLKIQVTRLNIALKSLDQADNAQEIATDLKTGLNSAYRQLRELLTTFRIKPDERGFVQTLHDSVEEFNHRTEIDITLDNQLDELQLNENEEIHVIQVIREALSNAVRHSAANTIHVALSGNDTVSVSITDDGCGLINRTPRARHYGFAIMKERISSLGGKLDIHSDIGDGTRVSFNFTPKSSNTINLRIKHGNTA